MSARTAFIDLIESAERSHPGCPQCGAVVIATARDGAIWLECPTLAEPRPFLRQLIKLDFEAAHSRSLLLSETEAIAA